MSIRRAQEIVDRALRADGLGRLDDKLGDQRPEALILGKTTTLDDAMHADPRHGVVDATAGCTARRTLTVTAGRSSTVSSANPTLTVVALAICFGNHLRALGMSSEAVRSKASALEALRNGESR